MIAQRLKRWVPKGRFVRAVSVLAGGTVIGQGLVMASSPLLTRLYAPEDFGVLGAYTAVLSLVIVVASLLYEVAIPLPAEDEEAANVLVLALAVAWGMSLISAVILWLCGDWIVRMMNVPGLKAYLWMVPLALFGGGIYQALTYWAVRAGEYGRIAETKLRQSVGLVAVQVGLGFGKWSAFGLLFGDLVGRFLGSGSLAKTTSQRGKQALRGVSWAGMREVALRYRRFPLVSGWPTLINAVVLQLPALLLTLFYGPSVVGWFVLAQRVLGVPMSLIGTSVSQVYMGEAARLAKQEPEQLGPLFWKTTKHMLWIGAPLVGALAVVAPSLFSFVFGAEWRESGEYVQALAVMVVLQFVSMPIGGNLFVLERQDLHLVREVLRIVLMAGAVALAHLRQEPPLTAVLFVSAAGSLGYLFHMFVSWLSMARFLGGNLSATVTRTSGTDGDDSASA